MPQDAATHAAAVERWLEAAGDELSAPALISLLERALATLWNRASRTLGEVTLSAIVERVLYVASEEYPFVAINRSSATPGRFEVRQLGAVQHDRRLRTVVGFVIAELVGVLGALTDEILTPGLLAALETVGREQDAGIDDAEGGT